MGKSETYDYIIAGAGASGLSLAWHLVHSPLRDKRILIVDADLTPSGDKTWCFWHAGDPPFSELIQKSWNRAEVISGNRHMVKPLDIFSYHCIRSDRLRSHILDHLGGLPNIDLEESPVHELLGGDRYASVVTGGGIRHADYIFQSCFRPEGTPSWPLVQHFLGWEVETREPHFDPSRFVLMDLDPTFKEGVAFMYILPWSENRALFEYTAFSKRPEAASFYHEKLEQYLFNRYKLKRIDYTIPRTEYGEIPMEDRISRAWYAPRILHLGTAGGQTKPSTGYTFSRIQRHSERITASLLANGRPDTASPAPFRYTAYDLWLLNIIHDHPEQAFEVFDQLFAHNELDAVFRFLDEQATLREDLDIMASVPWRPFLRAIRKNRRRLISLWRGAAH